MIRMTMALALGSAICAAPVSAQTAPTPAAASAAPDPARVAAARGLIDVLMPPATREQMLQSIITPMIANLRRGMSQNPQLAAMFKDDPKKMALFDAFMARQDTRISAMMHDALPGMVPAMANAYARRFTVEQIRDIRAFFETPTGRAYMQASFTIMNDPDIADWQRGMMARTMTNVQADVTEFAGQMAATGATKP